MTSQPAPVPNDPRHVLTSTSELVNRVRTVQRGAWFPLLVFALVTFASAPFARYGARHPAHCTSISGGYVCSSYSRLALWYWPLALLLGYAVISWFYVRRSHRRGVGTRIQPYVLVGVVLVVAGTVWALWAAAHPGFLEQTLHVRPGAQPAVLFYRIAGPAGAIGLALLLLARIERSAALFAVTVAYLIVVASPLGAGRVTHPSRWAFLPHLLVDGGVLLVGAVVLAVLDRVQNRSSA